MLTLIHQVVCVPLLISHRTSSAEAFPWLIPVCGLRFEVFLSGSRGSVWRECRALCIESSLPAILRVAFSLARDLWFPEKADRH